ncbi:hypothetical protein SCB17_003073 [Clostridium perfringens]|nr:hypothetical protein [Clostridium perfringens]
MKYTVKDVVCDYGVYEDDKLILILNSHANARLISDTLNSDLEGHNKYDELIKPFMLELQEKEKEIKEQKAFIYRLLEERKTFILNLEINSNISEEKIKRIVLKTISDISKTSISKTRGI